MKIEKIKIFEDKSQIINKLRDEIEILNKQLNEQTRKGIIDESVIKNHESEIDSFKEKIKVLRLEKNEREYIFSFF